MIIIISISILLISGIVLAIKKISPSFQACPICAGVSGTWLGMLIASYLGYPMDLVIIGLLMGGSVVGIAHQLERKIRVNKVLAWKILFIPAGFTVAYNLIYFSWPPLILLSAIILLLLFIFLEWPMSKQNGGRGGKVEYIEKEMENCC